MAGNRGDGGRPRKRKPARPRDPLPGDGIGFWIKGTDLAPEDDPAWLELAADHPGRRAFWEQSAELGIAFYTRERMAGRDAAGRKLRKLAEYTVKHRHSAMGTADPHAPPLIPAHGLSRTISLLRYAIRKDGLWFYWAEDPHLGGTWGSILARHRAGRDVPRRDVIGLGKRVRNSIRSRALKWWQAHRGTYSPATAAEYGWKPSGPGREFFRPRTAETISGAEIDSREGWYQDRAGRKRATPKPDWAKALDAEISRTWRAAYVPAPVSPPRLVPPAAVPPAPARVTPAPGRRPPAVVPPVVVRPPAVVRPPEILPPPQGIPSRAKPAPTGSPASRPPAPPAFGPSKATVVLPDDPEKRQALEESMLGVMRGEVVPPSHFASLIGAPDNARVHLTAGGEGTLHWRVESPDLAHYYGRIERFEEETSLHVDRVTVLEGRREKGVTTEIHGRMVEWATHYRLTDLKLAAARTEEKDGYIVWPILGYDGPLPADRRDAARALWPGVTRVRDVLESPGGRDWWYRHGASFKAAFDLSPGSADQAWWARYWQGKQGK